MPILVDTGALELLRRGNAAVERLAVRHFPPVICPQVAGEFLFGQARSGVSDATFRLAREFIDSFELLPSTADTAEHYAQLRSLLVGGGRTLPDPDYWIAAHALEIRVPLVSTDSDFRRIPGLDLRLISSR